MRVRFGRVIVQLVRTEECRDFPGSSHLPRSWLKRAARNTSGQNVGFLHFCEWRSEDIRRSETGDSNRVRFHSFHSA
jgi:hypothetical protein